MAHDLVPVYIPSALTTEAWLYRLAPGYIAYDLIKSHGNLFYSAGRHGKIQGEELEKMKANGPGKSKLGQRQIPGSG